VFVALGIQNAKRMRHIVMYDMPGSTVFWSHYLKKGHDFFLKYLLYIVCVFIFSAIFSATFRIYRRIERDMINMYIGFHLKNPLVLSNFWTLEFSQQSFEKYSNIKFRINPSGGSRVVACGQTDKTDTRRRRRRKKKKTLIFAFLQFCALKNS